MDVYFDYVESGSNITLGVVMVEDFDTILQQTKTVKKGVDTNFYHWTLEAMEYALELLLEDDFDEVNFKSQQRLIFDWLLKDSYKEQYDAYYEDIKKHLAKLVAEGGTFGYEIIKGDANRAKKYLKKHVPKMAGASVKGDLTGLFSTSNDKVVDFLQANRKKA